MIINRIFTEDNGVVIQLSGDITGAEIISAKASFKNNFDYYLYDFTNVEHIEISADEVADIAVQDIKLAQQTSNMQIVIVAGSDLIFGLGRMWQILVEDSPLKAGVFRSLDQANNWISENIQSLNVMQC